MAALNLREDRTWRGEIARWREGTVAITHFPFLHSPATSYSKGRFSSVVTATQGGSFCLLLKNDSVIRNEGKKGWSFLSLKESLG